MTKNKLFDGAKAAGVFGADMTDGELRFFACITHMNKAKVDVCFPLSFIFFWSMLWLLVLWL